MTNKAPSSSKLTQAQRSEKSRQKLIASCTESLISRGYSQTSTQLICEGAGLSKGGLFRQYPTRIDLMIDTARYIYDSLITSFEIQYQSENADDSKARKVAGLIQEVFKSEKFQAVLELTIASRTNLELKEGLTPIIQDNIQTVLGIARKLFPKAASENPKFDAVIHLLIMAFQGEVIDDLVYKTEELAKARFELLVEIAEREL